MPLYDILLWLQPRSGNLVHCCTYRAHLLLFKPHLLLLQCQRKQQLQLAQTAPKRRRRLSEEKQPISSIV